MKKNNLLAYFDLCMEVFILIFPEFLVKDLGKKSMLLFTTFALPFYHLPVAV